MILVAVRFAKDRNITMRQANCELSPIERKLAGKKQRAAKDESRHPPKDDPDPTGTISYPMHFKGKPVGKIIVPINLSKDDKKVLELTVAVVLEVIRQFRRSSHADSTSIRIGGSRGSLATAQLRPARLQPNRASSDPR